MSLVLVRVDDRLLHGQVMETWVPFCKATCVIVANEEASRDRIQRIALESCATEGVAVKVRGLKGLAEDINSGGLAMERIVILVSTLQDAMKVYSEGLRFSSINIGNLHHNGKTRRITPSVYLDKEDEEIVLRFKGLGIEVDVRAVPWDRQVRV
ncbi:MAG: PTS sugar transporter subunit IIB [Deltaproteobacteria bacterium]|nr:PTS sugar transporter subunit IIB [Deltaproteobacteria bacterium]